MFKARSQNCEKKRLLASSCLSVRPSVLVEQFGSHWRFYIKLDMWVFFENLSRKFKNNWHFTWRPISALYMKTNIGTLLEEQYRYFTWRQISVLYMKTNIGTLLEEQYRYFTWRPISVLYMKTNIGTLHEDQYRYFTWRPLNFLIMSLISS